MGTYGFSGGSEYEGVRDNGYNHGNEETEHEVEPGVGAVDTHSARKGKPERFKFIILCSRNHQFSLNPTDSFIKKKVIIKIN